MAIRPYKLMEQPRLLQPRFPHHPYNLVVPGPRLLQRRLGLFHLTVTTDEACQARACWDLQPRPQWDSTRHLILYGVRLDSWDSFRSVRKNAAGRYCCRSIGM